ncbi:uncharacterized protein Z518_11043 [Rhinocladiella mackenziei CBS 650.93]|uniref:Uncharacterized protein n=1 Tax=Rhinocladiella mackenziei CBS 650.93 TaxID=1442369 RepID=A0A0D2I8R8_9EURO|nr:uncharacterized protein Z518_11043 [Rhinocladiella mackenziei CBS 650.93]KIW99630.1 hypothetical protein Z518_11043 [Rhinocladiella mackenziei CBS 650.93]
MREILSDLDEDLGIQGGDRLNQKRAPRPIVRVNSASLRLGTGETEDVQLKDMTRPKLRRSETFEEQTKRENDERWTLRHAYFANMGGFRLRDSTGAVFIITAKHVNHLVRKRYIELPRITTIEINDRSKSDSLAKFLAIMQVGWLAVQVIARAIQKLETTTLEITTLSFVVCTLGSFIAWYRKPYDVQTFVVLDMPDQSIEDIDLTYTEKGGKHRNLLEEYMAAHPKAHVVDVNGHLLAPYTKLTIIDDMLPTYTSAFTDRYRHLWGSKPYNSHRIRNDRLPIMEKEVTAVVAVTTLAYAGLHAAAWNIPLATDIEQLLWRISSIVMIICCVAWFFMDHFEEYLSHRRTKKGRVGDGEIVPWWRIPASIVVAIAYSACRLYVLVESFLALRSMPKSAYEQVDWGRWVPHI